jgi:hypothetical protein
MRYESTPAGAVASYQPASEGPFRCDHCEYQTDLQCRKPEVLKEARELRGLGWHAKTVAVDAAGCCNFFEKL